MYRKIRNLFTLGLIFILTAAILTDNRINAAANVPKLQTTSKEDVEINLYDEDAITEDDERLRDIDSGSVYAWEMTGKTVQNTLSGINTAYWNSSNTLLAATDAYGQTVPAYCLQPKKASPNRNVKLIEGNSVLSPPGLQAAACAVSAFGYGGDGSDPNVAMFGGTYNKLAGGAFGSYVINGRLLRGLMINGLVYELHPQEAQALTAAAVHYFSSLAGQGNDVDIPTGSKIDPSHNENVINAFKELEFLGSHFMNQYGYVESVAYSVENGDPWERALDDYSADFSWQIKTKNNGFVSFNPQTGNLTDDNYLINEGSGNTVTIKITLSAAKCSLKLISQDYAVSNSGFGTVLPNTNTIFLPDGQAGCFNYFYVTANKSCTIDYGPLYNGALSQLGPYSTLTLPTFNQDVTITIPEESILSGISIEANTLSGFSATPIYGDGDHDGVSNYSCRLFSDINSNRDYQDVLFFSPGNTFTRNTSSNISGSFKYYGNLEIYKTSSNKKITDNNSCYSLENAVYTLYKTNNDASSGKNPVINLSTNKNGYVKSGNLEAGIYYLKETKAPKGYKLDNSIYTVVIEKGNTTSDITTAKIYLNDTPLFTPADIVLFKTDEAKNPLGDAEFTVKFYNILSDKNPAEAGISPVRTWVFKTDHQTGLAHFNDVDKVSGDEYFYDGNNVVLPMGTITIEETKAPTGYERNTYVEVQKLYSSDNISVISFNPPEITNKKIRQSVCLNKIGEIKSNTFIPLENAGFKACPTIELEKDENGEYIWNDEKAIVLTEDGEKEIFTDENGFAQTIPLDYGTYLFKETTVPINYLPIDDFLVDIVSSNPEVKNLGTFSDEGFKAYISITKRCGYSKENIINNPAKFSIWSYDDNSYVDFDGETNLTIDENGELTLPYPLYAGRYRLDETESPEGYDEPAKKGTDFIVDATGIYEISDVDSSCGLINIIVENKPCMGEISIIKSGESLIYNNARKIYDESYEPLPEVTFGIYAFEDIYTVDGHKTIIYKKDELVTEITTNDKGIATTQKLPYGKYIAKEIKTPNNYIPCDNIIITLDESNYTEEVYNKLLKSKISLKKTSDNTDLPVSGAYYALYEYNSNYTTANEYRADEYIEEKSTDENGNISFDTALPPGSYVVVETKAPDGYFISDDIELIKTISDSSDTKVLSANMFENVSIVSSAYSDLEDHYRDEYNYYNLTVSDKKIPETPKTPDTPRTGDRIKYVITGLFASVFCTLFIILALKRKRGNS